jgi:hypothetical protein
MSTVYLKEFSGIGLLLGSAGDSVGDFMGAFPGLLFNRVAFDEVGLADMREIQIVVELRGGPDLPGLDPAMIGRREFDEVWF